MLACLLLRRAELSLSGNIIRGYLEEYGYTVSDYTFADSNDVAAVTGNACNDSDVLYIPTDNTAATCTEAIQNVALPGWGSHHRRRRGHLFRLRRGHLGPSAITTSATRPASWPMTFWSTVPM